MPELPEVEHLRRRLREAWVGRTIQRFGQPRDGGDWKYVQNVTPDRFRGSLLGQRFTSVDRWGKYLIATLDSGHSWIVHLNQTGWWVPTNEAAELACAGEKSREDFLHSIELKHARIIVWVADQEWAYVDPRTWGKWYLYRREEAPKALAALGPDWWDDYDRAVLAIRAHSSRRKVKAVLTDQTVAAGLGNYLVCELLWRCQINPHQPWAEIGDPARLALAKQARTLLAECLSRTDRAHWAVFKRAGKLCWRCNETIVREADGLKRGTYLCPACQPRLT